MRGPRWGLTGYGIWPFLAAGYGICQKYVTGHGILKSRGSGITSKICVGYGKWCTFMSGYGIDLLCGIEMRSKSIKIFKDALDTFYLSFFLITDFISL